MLWILALMQVDGPSMGAKISFEEIFRQFHGFVVGFFRRRGLSPEESQDLAQDTFLRAYRAFDGFRGEAKASTWLQQIAINVWRNRHRDASAAKRDGQEVELATDHDTLPAPEPEVHELLIGDEKTRLLTEAIKKLPTQMRLCVTLRVQKERSYRDIAAILDISEGTAKSQISLAKPKLRSALAAHYPDLEAIL